MPGAKKSKKQRKVGRSARRPSHLRQAARTAMNKARRMFRQERLAGRQLPWPFAKPETLMLLNRLRYEG